MGGESNAFGLLAAKLDPDTRGATAKVLREFIVVLQRGISLAPDLVRDLNDAIDRYERG